MNSKFIELSELEMYAIYGGENEENGETENTTENTDEGGFWKHWSDYCSESNPIIYYSVAIDPDILSH